MTMTTTKRGYAAGTTVPIERSKSELDGLLGKHGATQRGLLHDEEALVACVVFTLAGRRYKIAVPLPMQEQKPPAGKWPRDWHRWGADRRAQWLRERWEQVCRERWRGLVLLCKAKLEIVALGLSTVDREFLADLLLPSGETAHERLGAYMTKLIAEGYTGPLALPEGGK